MLLSKSAEEQELTGILEHDSVGTLPVLQLKLPEQKLPAVAQSVLVVEHDEQEQVPVLLSPAASIQADEANRSKKDTTLIMIHNILL